MGVVGRGAHPTRSWGGGSEGLGPTPQEQVPTWTQRRAHLPSSSVSKGSGAQGWQDLPRSPRRGGSELGQILVSCVLSGGGPRVHAAAHLALEPSPGLPGRPGPGSHWVIRPQAQRRARNLPEETGDWGSVLPGPLTEPWEPCLWAQAGGLKPPRSPLWCE